MIRVSYRGRTSFRSINGFLDLYGIVEFLWGMEKGRRGERGEMDWRGGL
jgi:hypothetical protein